MAKKRGIYDIDKYAWPGGANKTTRDYFDSLLFELRHIDGVIPDTTLNLYGETFSTPIMVAAISHLNQRKANAFPELAKGALDAGAVMGAGMGDEAELESIIATGARTIKTIKPWVDNDEIFRKIEHAEKCGCLAIGMDLDHGMDENGGYGEYHGSHFRPKSLDEIRQFVGATKLPFIAKGILSEQDAYKCACAGVKGLVISHHHGGWGWDFAIPPLMILPKIVKLIGDKMPIFVDCGIENGFDVFKSLALGATGVWIGRVVLAAVLEDGASGVTDAIQVMTEQLAGAMSCTGSPDLRHIDPSVIWYK